ncbi:MAG: serine/threonine-protein kinase [Verrucomicrobiota bacterium]
MRSVVEISSRPQDTLVLKGRYEQYDMIGAGGLANIYHGWDCVDKRPIAIKRLTPEAVAAYHNEELGKGESELLSLCKHPNVVELYDSYKSKSMIYYIMELIHGQGLDRILDRAPLTQEDFIEVAKQALSGLGSIHKQSILHCDIKPENIMLDRDPLGKISVKILDFGLASFENETKTLAQLGKKEILGTPEYVSPELISGERAQYYSDIYSLGHVFYHALAGRSAFGHEEIKRIIQLHLEGAPKSLGVLRPDIGKPIIEAVHAMIERQPQNRPGNVEEVLKALDQSTSSEVDDC